MASQITSFSDKNNQFFMELVQLLQDAPEQGTINTFLSANQERLNLSFIPTLTAWARNQQKTEDKTNLGNRLTSRRYRACLKSTSCNPNQHQTCKAKT